MNMFVGALKTFFGLDISCEAAALEIWALIVYVAESCAYELVTEKCSKQLADMRMHSKRQANKQANTFRALRRRTTRTCAEGEDPPLLLIALLCSFSLSQTFPPPHSPCVAMATSFRVEFGDGSWKQLSLRKGSKLLTVTSVMWSLGNPSSLKRKM